MRQYWQALGSVTKRPVFIQTTGGTAYKGPIPSVDLLIELAREFPNFGYVKEEAGNVIARTRALLAAKPPIRRVFSARGGFGGIYELRLGMSVSDRYGLVIADRKKLRSFANLHFTPASSQLMGQHIAARILESLSQFRVLKNRRYTRGKRSPFPFSG